MKSRLSRHLRIEPTRGPLVEAFAVVPGEALDVEALAASQEITHDPPLAARDEAVFLLHAAAEVEHALMVQYLYAAYSLLDAPQLPQDKVQLVETWREALFEIAREEMGHLASVQNLLHFIGGPLNLEREDFPFRTGLYPFRFKLERLTKDSLAKYVYAEMPEGLAGEDIDEIRRRALKSNADPVNHVGRLYQSIASLFARKEQDGTFRLRDADLQAEPIGFQAGPEWRFGHGNLIVRQVKTRDGAQDGAIPLLQAIAVQGEGMPATGEIQGSHYQRFREIYDAFPEANDWQPSRVVPADPNTSEPDQTEGIGPDAEAEAAAAAGRISHTHSRLWAQLLNLRYRMLLTDIFHVFQIDTSPSADPKLTLLRWIRTEMRANIRGISTRLVQMPQHQGDTAGPPFAAPPFELPYTLSLPDREPNRWRLHRDLLLASQALIVRILEKLNDEPGSLPATLIQNLRSFATGLGTRDATDLQFAESMIGPGIAPSAVFVPLAAAPRGAMRFTAVKDILEESVSGEDIGAHGNFWRDLTRDRFVAFRVFGRPLLQRRADGTFDENESNLVKALEGRTPFGSDIGTPSSVFRRMPAGLNPVAAEKVEVIRQWIRDGCPDDTP